MRLRQVEYFVAVVEAGSITQAAANLYLAQPSLSHQITTLEKELGGALFERMPRGLRLTPAGRAFLVEAKRIVSDVNRAKRAVQSVTEGVLGELEISTITSLAVGVIPSVARRWREHHPKMALRLHEYTHADRLEEGLLNGVGDFGFGPIPKLPMGEVIELGTEEFVFVLPSDDPLAGQHSVDPAELANRPWVLYDHAHGLSNVVTAVCSAHGFAPTGAVRTSQVESAARLAAAGLGPALLPANVIPTQIEAVVLSATKPLIRRLAAFSRAPMPEVVRSFVDEIADPSHGLVPATSLPDEYFEL
ncbi:LysR family transcriptional regulator [Mycolicibacterium goodii]|uniref:LysR family transcriptional regulator n=1 Tax=Mycolicibacterium goodii TaxID=134601 RepID=A0ABS6HY37_MYCGD|nr:LysR family transcriptional regulator [Mycolicibacterium goodii]MBU8826599.1 LysR family transcriptional regulator [Mycolicibacterium goodii]MBU8840031.1 LysR family transcriptional regulator [Mycolicibacterium goodii]